MILIHGALGAPGQFNQLAQALPQPTHLLNLEGHGPRSLEGPYTLAGFTQNLLELLDEQAIPQADIFGYSMGGYVALWAAAHHPERIRRVFTLGTMITWSPQLAEKENRMLDADTISTKVPAFAATLKDRHSGIGWHEVLTRTRDLLTTFGETNPLTAETLARIIIPVRLAIGDRDRNADLADTYRVYQHLPNAQFEVLPNTPHPIEKVDTARLAASITEFFGD